MRAFIFALCGASLAAASPVTFVTSLPVARDQIIVRFNFQPAFSTKQQLSLQAPISIGYGLTSRLGIFAGLSQGKLRWTARGRGSQTAVPAILRSTRATRFSRSTSRAPVFGSLRLRALSCLRAPTISSLRAGCREGVCRPGPALSIPMPEWPSVYVASRWNAATDCTYRLNPLTKTNFSPGSELRLDGNVDIKLAPLPFPEEGLPRLLNLDIETNYYLNRRDHANGIRSANSGGKLIRQTVSLQISSLRWQAGIGMQAPLMQDLNGTGRTRLKVGYLAFFEYYLAAPVWRKKG